MVSPELYFVMFRVITKRIVKVSMIIRVNREGKWNN